MDDLVKSLLNAEIRNGNEKTNSEVVNDCPVCGREVASSRFAPHLSKCLGIGGRRPAAIKKTIRSDAGEFDHSAKASSLPPSDPSTALGKKHAAGNSNKKRGRPPKKPQGVILTPAEHDALLSNAINNATQRLHLQGSTPAGKFDDDPSNESMRMGGSERSNSTVPTAVQPSAFKSGALERPILRRRSSSQADSSDGSDSD
ncbi:hypothetical protein BY996DRAFT_6416182 [Phakopsora pachyrhizi]|nr:hypothetical protein BY996DRAFT_6416182 [Phakopsora pachyrhizi]